MQPVPYGTTLHNPDFAALARACGADGATIDGTSDVGAVLRAAFAQLKRPTVLEVRCDPAVMAPLSRWEPNAAARLGD